MRQATRNFATMRPISPRLILLILSALAMAAFLISITPLGGTAGAVASRWLTLAGWGAVDSLPEVVAAIPGVGRADELRETSRVPVIDRFANAGDSRWLALPFVWPVRGDISTYYREAGPYWVGGYHQGIDFAVDHGTPVHAASGGLVVMADYANYKGYGAHVLIDHGGGVATFYAHLSAIDVEEGQQVARGDIIGLVGDTGVAVGPHLHFEVRVDGELANPLLYLP